MVTQKPRRPSVAASRSNIEVITKDLKALDDLVERSLTVSDESLREQINI